MTDESRPERRVSARRAVDHHGRPVYSGGPIIRTLAVTNAIAAIAAIVALIVSLTAQQGVLDQFGEGRAFAVGFTCAVESAVGQAGYDVITRGAVMPETAFSRFLEQHGYPPPRVRAVQAARAGRQYVQSLSQNIVAKVGPKGAKLIRADGSLDCVRLAQLSRTRPLSRPSRR